MNRPKKGQGPALELSNQGKSLFSGTNVGGGAIVTGNVPLRGASTGGLEWGHVTSRKGVGPRWSQSTINDGGIMKRGRGNITTLILCIT